MRETAFSLRYFAADDREIVDRLVDKLTIFKLSTIAVRLVDLGSETTQTKLMRVAADVERYATEQATISGARRAVHSPDGGV